MKMNYQEKQTGKYQDLFPGYHNIQNGAIYPRVEIDLEQITSENRKYGTLDTIFSDKTKILKSTVKELLQEIEQRKGLNSKLFGQIDEDICKFRTYLHEVGDVCERKYDSDDLKFGKRRGQLESLVLNLEQEKRKEYAECWRDMMFLRKYLMSALSDYWEFSGKKNSLTDGFSLAETADGENSS